MNKVVVTRKKEGKRKRKMALPLLLHLAVFHVAFGH